MCLLRCGRITGSWWGSGLPSMAEVAEEEARAKPLELRDFFAGLGACAESDQYLRPIENNCVEFFFGDLLTNRLVGRLTG